MTVSDLILKKILYLTPSSFVFGKNIVSLATGKMQIARLKIHSSIIHLLDLDTSFDCIVFFLPNLDSHTNFDY
jgi:hypothetical protein